MAQQNSPPAHRLQYASRTNDLAGVSVKVGARCRVPQARTLLGSARENMFRENGTVWQLPGESARRTHETFSGKQNCMAMPGESVRHAWIFVFTRQRTRSQKS